MPTQAERLADAAGLADAAAQAAPIACDDAAERLTAVVVGLVPGMDGEPRECAA